MEGEKEAALPFRIQHQERQPNPSHAPLMSPRKEPLSRVAGVGEDPLTWTVPLGSFRGLRLGIHAIFPIWALAECAAALPDGWSAVLLALTAVAAYAAVALARELVRAWWASRAGLDVHEIIVWPLGGLTSFATASARPSPWSDFGGLIFTALLLAPFTWFVATTSPGWAIVRGAVFEPSQYLDVVGDPLRRFIFRLFHASLVLSAFHALAPMTPFDLSRVWERRNLTNLSPVDAAASSFRRSIFVALALLIAGAAQGQERLMAVAVFSGLAAFIEYRRVMFLHRPLLTSGMLDDVAIHAHASNSSGVAYEADDDLPVEVHLSLPDIDDVLEKITRSGMSSLSQEDRQALEEATRRSRGESSTRGSPAD